MKRWGLWLLVALVLIAVIAINVWYYKSVVGSDLPVWAKIMLLR